MPDEHIQPFLLGEAPRLLFPFARRVLADAVRDGGFPPLLLEPIDFDALYYQQPEAQRSEPRPASRARPRAKPEPIVAGRIEMNLGTRARLGRRADPRQPGAGARPRFAVGALRRRGLRVRRVPDRLPPAQHVPRAVRGRGVFGRVHPDVQPQGGGGRRAAMPARDGSPRTRCRCCCPILIVMTVVMELAAWPVTWVLSGGFNDISPRRVRLRGRAVADHLPLSAADQPGVAARRHPQFAAPILGQRRRADPAQR